MPECAREFIKRDRCLQTLGITRYIELEYCGVGNTGMVIVRSSGEHDNATQQLTTGSENCPTVWVVGMQVTCIVQDTSSVTTVVGDALCTWPENMAYAGWKDSS